MAGSARRLADKRRWWRGNTTHGPHSVTRDAETREESWRRRRAEYDGIKRGRAPPANRRGHPIISSNHLATRSVRNGRTAASPQDARIGVTRRNRANVRADRHVAMQPYLPILRTAGWALFLSSRVAAAIPANRRCDLKSIKRWLGRGMRKKDRSDRSVTIVMKPIAYREQARYFTATEVSDLEIPMFWQVEPRANHVGQPTRVVHKCIDGWRSLP